MDEGTKRQADKRPVGRDGRGKWARDDSNVRPRPYQGRALTN
jgi:hypothetical protein